jgi:hypothetical protein
MNLTEFERAGIPMEMRGKDAVPVWRHSLPDPVGKADAPKV